MVGFLDIVIPVLSAGVLGVPLQAYLDIQHAC